MKYHISEFKRVREGDFRDYEDIKFVIVGDITSKKADRSISY